MKARLLAAMALSAAVSAGCATASAPPKTALPHTLLSPGWVDHVLYGVHLAAPAKWKIGPDPNCAAIPADTIGGARADDGSLAPGEAVMIGVTNCPAGRTSPSESIPSAAWVSIDCVVASRVGLPIDTFLNTSGPQRVLQRGSNPFYVIGRGQVIEVAAGTDSVAQQIMRSVVPTGQRC